MTMPKTRKFLFLANDKRMLLFMIFSMTLLKDSVSMYFLCLSCVWWSVSADLHTTHQSVTLVNLLHRSIFDFLGCDLLITSYIQ